VEFGICKLSNVPLRAEASDKSELVSQVFFGECYQVLIRQGNWLHIKVLADSYEGWIDYKQHYPVTPEYAAEWQARVHPRALDIVQTVSSQNDRIPILIGSTLPFFDGINIRINDKKMFYNGRASNPTAAISPNFLIKIAKTFLKAPYVWGGRSVFGIDCSGFVQQVYGICGQLLPRDAWQQVSVGQEVHFASQTQPGDLAFFDNDEGRIIHVGILLENQQIIHAHGEVRIDYLDHQGIYNLDKKRYSHKLRIIKRILPAAF
jgi:gamma-D-glutamyl-L-lysine dipeptidyl-peptidase